MAGDDKLKALDAAIAKLEKDFGKGAVMKLGDAAANVSVETVPTGSLSLDICTWSWWSAKGTYHRDLRTGVKW